MRDWNAMLLLKEITQESRILYMYCSLAPGLLENVVTFYDNIDKFNDHTIIL